MLFQLICSDLSCAFSLLDPADYILWNAQIYATQGSMARCRVPDVMTLYEKCMKNMYKRNRCDDVTLSKLKLLDAFQTLFSH